MVVDLNSWLCGGDESSWLVVSELPVVLVGVCRVTVLGDMCGCGCGRGGLLSLATGLDVDSCFGTECLVTGVNVGLGMALMTCGGS